MTAQLCLCAAVALPVAAQAVQFKEIDLRARALAAEGFRPPSVKLPSELAALDYDALRDIRFRPDRATWRAEKLPFELMYFHPGKNFPDAVRINISDARGAKRVEFDPELFDYGRNKIDPKKLRGVGFSGFRVHYPVNKSSYKDEVLVFLGASYFRAVGKGQTYGLSARGLAIDTAVPAGEDFARRDGHRRMPAEFGEPGEVIGRERLLEPSHIVSGEHLRGARRASRTSARSMCALIAKPTTRRENRSRIAAGYSQPSAVRTYVMSVTHATSGAPTSKPRSRMFFAMGMS